MTAWLLSGVGPGRAAAQSIIASTDPLPAVEVVQTTSDLSQRLTRLPNLAFGTDLPHGVPVIHVDESAHYQRVAGFGAAMTDSSAWLLQNGLSAADRAAVMNELFGPSGIRLSYMRIPIGASDFTKDGTPYSYDDMPRGQSDYSLSRFSVAHDTTYVIPALRQMLAVNPRISILASPWSPPAWMKANGSLLNLNNRGALRSAAYRPLAHYFVKFIEAYAHRGIPIAAVTPQNEPGNGTSYPGAEFPESIEAKWLVNDLLPEFKAARLHPKIYGFDWGWAARSYTYAAALVADRAARFLTGIASHCYFGSPSVMTKLRSMAPRLEQIVDECATGITPVPPSEVVIASMRNWATTVLLWNVALDPHGGPVQPPNGGCGHCTAVVKIDPLSGAFTYDPSFFQLGQASGFIQLGATRIGSDHFVSYGRPPGGALVGSGLDDVAFRNPDGTRVLLAYNNASRPRHFAVQWAHRSFAYTLPALGTVTFRWAGR